MSIFADPFATIQALAVLDAQTRNLENAATVALAESDGLGVQLRGLAADVRSAAAGLEEAMTR